mmetsp:Transcript_7798/g.25534  ORF Transcript_7798/g.25534 Transcript_7798/m.25534 type:complete len:348 (-) Transcript_7798:38-1081(-)
MPTGQSAPRRRECGCSTASPSGCRAATTAPVPVCARSVPRRSRLPWYTSAGCSMPSGAATLVRDPRLTTKARTTGRLLWKRAQAMRPCCRAKPGGKTRARPKTLGPQGRRIQWCGTSAKSASRASVSRPCTASQVSHGRTATRGTCSANWVGPLAPACVGVASAQTIDQRALAAGRLAGPPRPVQASAFPRSPRLAKPQRPRSAPLPPHALTSRSLRQRQSRPKPRPLSARRSAANAPRRWHARLQTRLVFVLLLSRRPPSGRRRAPPRPAQRATRGLASHASRGDSGLVVGPVEELRREAWLSRTPLLLNPFMWYLRAFGHSVGAFALRFMCTVTRASSQQQQQHV